jgi:hypothetical protein
MDRQKNVAARRPAPSRASTRMADGASAGGVQASVRRMWQKMAGSGRDEGSRRRVARLRGNGDVAGAIRPRPSPLPEGEGAEASCASSTEMRARMVSFEAIRDPASRCGTPALRRLNSHLLKPLRKCPSMRSSSVASLLTVVVYASKTAQQPSILGKLLTQALHPSSFILLAEPNGIV